MTVSAKDIRAQLRSVRSYVEQLDSVIEERSRLVATLKLTPSQADNLDLINLLAKTKAALEYLRRDIGAGYAAQFALDFSGAVDAYSALLAELRADAYIDAHEYEFTDKIEPADKKKSVRFKDYDHDEDTAQMRNELMGTAALFQPYHDEPDQRSLLSVDTTNQELFALHQQQLMEQDENLDRLHELIRTQHSMGHMIHDELDDHVILLDDLESGVDGATTRLRRASRRLDDFRRRMRENGSLVTIVVLTVILILLLVVLN